MKRIYIERAIRTHPRTQRVLARYPNAVLIEIDRYGEVFNRRDQNFRLQKKNPALILAQKHDGFVLPTPPGYGIGGAHNLFLASLKLRTIADIAYKVCTALRTTCSL